MDIDKVDKELDEVDTLLTKVTTIFQKHWGILSIAIVIVAGIVYYFSSNGYLNQIIDFVKPFIGQ